MTLTIEGKRIPVDSLSEARAKFRAWIEDNGFGASNLAKSDGLVRDETKPKNPALGRFSYNGRFWEPGDWPTAKEIII